MNYEIIETGVVKDRAFHVYEKPTNQYIKSFNKNIDAKMFMRHLNLGGGFDGWTPTFMLVNFSHLLNNDNNKNM